jgi:hypothetical protein
MTLTKLPLGLPGDIEDCLLDLVSEHQARSWILDRLYPQGLACPKCGAVQDHALAGKMFALDKLICSSCGLKINALFGSILDKARMSPQKLALLLVLFKLGHNNAVISRILGMDPSSIFHRRKIVLASGGQLWIGCQKRKAAGEKIQHRGGDHA